MSLVTGVAKAVPDLVLTVVAVLGLAVLIGLSAWELPVGDND